MKKTLTHTVIRKRLGIRVKELRQERELTQQSLADAVGIDRTYVSGIENGRRKPSFECVVSIAQSLDVTVSQLTDGIDAENDRGQ